MLATIVSCATSPDDGAADSDLTRPRKKWHPGSYLYLGRAHPKVLPYADNPNIRGYQIVYDWGDLEPKKGVYDFSTIEADLDGIKKVGKRLIIQWNDRTFNGKDCVPAYMLTPRYGGGQSLTFSATGVVHNCSARRWDPAVQKRRDALIVALGARFDRDLFVEAMNTAESASNVQRLPGNVGCTPEQAIAAKAQCSTNVEGYSQGAVLESYETQMIAAAGAFPRTLFWQGVNWTLNRRGDELFDVAVVRGVGFTGPDILPLHQTEAYPLYEAYAGQVPLAMAGQTINRVEDIGAPEVMYDFALHTLKLNHVMWVPRSSPVYTFERILARITADGGVTNPDCPSAIRCATN